MVASGRSDQIFGQNIKIEWMLMMCAQWLKEKVGADQDKRLSRVMVGQNVANITDRFFAFQPKGRRSIQVLRVLPGGSCRWPTPSFPPLIPFTRFSMFRRPGWLPWCLFGLSKWRWFWWGEGGRLVGERLAGERSTCGGEFGDWHFGTTLCKQERGQDDGEW